MPFFACFLALCCLCKLKSQQVCIHRRQGCLGWGGWSQDSLEICTSAYACKLFCSSACLNVRFVWFTLQFLLLHSFIYIYSDLCLFSTSLLLLPSLPSFVWLSSLWDGAWAVPVGPHGAVQEVAYAGKSSRILALGLLFPGPREWKVAQMSPDAGSSILWTAQPLVDASHGLSTLGLWWGRNGALKTLWDGNQDVWGAFHKWPRCYHKFVLSGSRKAVRSGS